MTKLAQILVVEDDEIDIMAVKRALKKARIINPVTIAHDGVEALEVLRGKDGHPPLPRPYVILLDINLPRMNGLEFLRHLRADDTLTKSVVFVLTTSADERDVDAAYRSHVAGYVVKSDYGKGMEKVAAMLRGYWRAVALPD